jgi:hypothetical protein
MDFFEVTSARFAVLNFYSPKDVEKYFLYFPTLKANAITLGIQE